MPQVLRRVGRYDVVEVIGRGGAAVVYLARQRDLQRHVALKELAPFHADDATFAERFVEESRLAGSLSHANVVTVHEYFEDGGVPYIAMEYLPHGSLRQYVGALSIAQIAGVLEGVLAGLSHGEAKGIAHRDLKPENLLVAADGRVKIADFGVARAYNKAVTRAVVTAAGTTIGTPAYMAPEQALGGELTAATDLYSLGIIAWELLTGHVPFEEDDTPVAVLYRHVHEPVPPMSSVAPDVDERLEEWVTRMLAKRPEDRFHGAEAAWEALEDLVLDLRGPRWRREARLIVEGAGAHAERPLTPAGFSDGGVPLADAGESGRWPVAKTITDAEPGAAEAGQAVAHPAGQAVAHPAGQAVAHPAGQAVAHPAGQAVAHPAAANETSQATVPPKREPRAIHTTMFRIARRHRDGRSDVGDAPRGGRRRAIALVIALAMAAAAVGGWALAATGSHPSKPRTSPNAATQTQLTATIQSLATTVRRDHTRLLKAHSSAQQADDAAALQTAYATAATKLLPLEGKSSKARPLHAALAGTASAYGRLAAAARANDKAAYKAAAGQVRANERRLQAEVGTL